MAVGMRAWMRVWMSWMAVGMWVWMNWMERLRAPCPDILWRVDIPSVNSHDRHADETNRLRETHKKKVEKINLSKTTYKSHFSSEHVRMRACGCLYVRVYVIGFMKSNNGITLLVNTSTDVTKKSAMCCNKRKKKRRIKIKRGQKRLNYLVCECVCQTSAQVAWCDYFPKIPTPSSNRSFIKRKNKERKEKTGFICDKIIFIS